MKILVHFVFLATIFSLGSPQPVNNEPPESEPDPEYEMCNYPDVDNLSDRIISHMRTVIPVLYSVPDDNKGRIRAKDITVNNLNAFERRLPSSYSCDEQGLVLTIPIKWIIPITSSFQASLGFTGSYGWVPCSGTINTLEADATVNVNFVDNPELHVRVIKVVTARDIELGIEGSNFFAKLARKGISIIANEFKERIRKDVEISLQELLDKAMVTVPLTDLGFEFK